MKPLIMKVNDCGKPIMSAEEIQKMIEEAYQMGLEDGKKQNSTITVPTCPIDINDNKEWWKRQVYCSTNMPLDDRYPSSIMEVEV